MTDRRAGLTVMWVGVVLVGGAGLATLARATLRPLVEAVPAARVGPPGPRSIPARYAADSLARDVVRRDVFRVGRHPAAVAYDPVRGAAPPPPGPPKPALVLTGIVWGAAPEAVVEGLPNASGPRVLRVGDVWGGVRVRRIAQNRVVLSGFDTTWTLTVREPWKP